MTILSYVIAVLFGLSGAWVLDHFVFPRLGRLLDDFRNRKGGAS